MDARIIPRARMFAVRLFRFGLIGAIATLSYFIVATIGALLLNLSPMLNNVVAWSLSLIVSYVGHNYYTFEAQGHHAHYFPRYFIATGVLFGVLVAVTYVLERVFRLTSFPIAIVVTICYPIVSVLINMRWTFRSRSAVTENPYADVAANRAAVDARDSE